MDLQEMLVYMLRRGHTVSFLPSGNTITSPWLRRNVILAHWGSVVGL